MIERSEKSNPDETTPEPTITSTINFELDSGKSQFDHFQVKTAISAVVLWPQSSHVGRIQSCQRERQAVRVPFSTCADTPMHQMTRLDLIGKIITTTQPLTGTEHRLAVAICCKFLRRRQRRLQRSFTPYLHMAFQRRKPPAFQFPASFRTVHAHPRESTQSRDSTSGRVEHTFILKESRH